MIVYIDIITYEMCFNGKHFYGKLDTRYSDGDQDVRLRHKLSQKEASYLNKKDSCRGQFKNGDLTERFPTEKALLAEAKKVWRDEFPKGVLLINGSSSSGSVEHAIDGPDRASVDRINALADEADKLNYYSGKDDDRMMEIDKEFDAITENLLRCNSTERNELQL